MNITEIKTHHGLILQSLLSTALTQAGFTFRENWQYDPDLERPDFTIPDSDKPKFALEVHQTDARNSFQMKTLRSLNAVAEAKIFFGKNLVSANILFGDPNTELPESNFKALCGIFDINLVPRYDSKEGVQAKRLEEQALKLAEDETHDVASAASKLRTTCKKEIKAISSILKRSLKEAVADKNLTKIWDLEKKRIAALGPAPGALPTTHYKRCILESLYLSDQDFTELIKVRDPNKGSKSLRTQLVDTGLATVRKIIRGERLELIPRMQTFIGDPSATDFRALCEDRISDEPAMLYFVEDIRDQNRRETMAKIFLSKIQTGKLEEVIAENLIKDTVSGIEHRRCWILDLATRSIGISNGVLSRMLYQSGRNPGNMGDPISHLVPKTDRARGLSERDLMEYASVTCELILQLSKSNNVDFSSITPTELASRLLALRLDGIIKLQKLNPLYIYIESVAKELGVSAHQANQSSLINDLSQTNAPVGKSGVFILKKDDDSCVLNSLYVGEGYGSDHKADEWSARIRSLGYRIKEGVPLIASHLANILVLDGEWSEKSIKKLHTAGWTHICQLPQVEDTLRRIFGIKKLI